MGTAAANLTLHRKTGWLSGSVGPSVVARRTRIGSTAQLFLQPGMYQIIQAQIGQSARGFIVEGGLGGGSERAIIIEGGRTVNAVRAFVIEGGRNASGERAIIIEGGRGTASERSIIIEGGLDWLSALENGTLTVIG